MTFEVAFILNQSSIKLCLKFRTLKIASAQVVETSVNNNSPSQDSNHPDDLFQSRYVTPGFKPFSYFYQLLIVAIKEFKTLEYFVALLLKLVSCSWNNRNMFFYI